MRGCWAIFWLGIFLPFTGFGITLRQTNFNDAQFDDFLEKETKAVALVFMGTHCPLVKQYVPTLKRLNDAYKGKGIVFLGVYSDKNVNVFSMAKHAMEFDVPFTVVQDVQSELAEEIHSDVLSKVFLLNRKREVLYEGMIDDQFSLGGRKAKPTREPLKDAIEDVLGGREVAVAATAVRGCAIQKYDPKEKPEAKYYYGDVEPIMQKKCQPCHRPGEVGAVFDSFLTYDDVSNYASTIQQVVVDGRMPPSYTLLSSHFGKMKNDRRLTDEEVKIIDAWVRNGAPAGDKSKALAPVKWPDGEWKIGKPDVVLKMQKPFTLPATGIIDYQFIKLKLNYPEDKWVTAVEIRPGNKAVVHHAELHVVKSDDEDYSGTSGMMKVYGFTGDKAVMLAGFVPGDDDDNARVLPLGYAMKIPKNHDLVLELHYTTTGKVESDQTSAALIFAKEKPAHEMCNHAFRYPRTKLHLKAGDDHTVGQKDVWFKKDVLLWSIRGHMHKLGKSWKLEWVDGQEKKLFAGIPTWNFGWQRSFDFAEPLEVHAGQVLLMTGIWDNSRRNPYNSDPTIDKTWGVQSDDEMLNTRVKYSIKNNEGGKFSCLDAVP